MTTTAASSKKPTPSYRNRLLETIQGMQSSSSKLCTLLKKDILSKKDMILLCKIFQTVQNQSTRASFEYSLLLIEQYDLAMESKSKSLSKQSLDTTSRVPLKSKPLTEQDVQDLLSN